MTERQKNGPFPERGSDPTRAFDSTISKYGLVTGSGFHLEQLNIREVPQVATDCFGDVVNFFAKHSDEYLKYPGNSFLELASAGKIDVVGLPGGISDSQDTQSGVIKVFATYNNYDSDERATVFVPGGFIHLAMENPSIALFRSIKPISYVVDVLKHKDRLTPEILAMVSENVKVLLAHFVRINMSRTEARSHPECLEVLTEVDSGIASFGGHLLDVKFRNN